MSILKDLNLTEDLFELKGSITEYCKGDEILNSEDIKKELNRLNKKLEKLAKSNKTLSLQRLCKKYLDNKEYNFYKDYTNEWYEYREQNANTVFQSWKNYGRICKLKGGLSQVIKKLYNILRYYIKFEYDVKSITKVEEKYKVNDEIECNRVYLCTNYTGAKMIKYVGINMKDILSICKPLSCIRVYIKFRDNHNLPSSLVSNKLFKWSIKITDKIVMASYTDGINANKLAKLGEKEAVKTILEEISECTGTKLGKIEKVHFAYWKEGYDIVKSTVTKNRYNKVTNSLPENFYQTICPLDYGLNQAWMEAHLLEI